MCGRRAGAAAGTGTLLRFGSWEREGEKPEAPGKSPPICQGHGPETGRERLGAHPEAEA